MSHTFDRPDTGPTTAFYQGVESGRRKERERIIELLIEEGLLPPNDNYGQQIIELIEGNKNEI